MIAYEKIMKKYLYSAKSFVSKDLIEIFVSVIISTLLEIARRIIIYVNSIEMEYIKEGVETTNGIVDISNLSKAFDLETCDSIIGIILLTLIIWGVAGLAKIMEKENPGKKKKIHTLIMLVVFILSVLWYVFKIKFVINYNLIIFSTAVCVVLVVTLATYLANNEFNCNIFRTDNRVA